MRGWDRFFFEERPTSLGFFRIALAICIGLHVLPTFIPLADNYLQTAYKEKHPVFFPAWILELVDLSPDGVVFTAVAIFCLAWFFFLIGYRTQWSTVLTLLGCYYFYALNSRDLRTLAWDALLISLFLFSLAPSGRSFFIQRLLQLQLVWIYFYSGLAKIWPGNWASGNAYYYLINAPAEWAVRDFPLRDFLAGRPGLCYGLGLGVVALELSLPFLLFIRRTRLWAVGLGIFFHGFLFATMHVPLIFPVLFISQLLLFIPPSPGKRTVDFSKSGNIMNPNLAPPADPVEEGVLR